MWLRTWTFQKNNFQAKISWFNPQIFFNFSLKNAFLDPNFKFLRLFEIDGYGPKRFEKRFNMSKIKFCSKNFDNMKSEKKNFRLQKFTFLAWILAKICVVSTTICNNSKMYLFKRSLFIQEIIEQISRPCKHTNIVFFWVFL